MGKFTNTDYKDIINSIVDGNNNRLKNTYYLFTDKKATIGEYYNKSSKMSTLDESTRLEYSPVGLDSPNKFNVIHNAIIYGLNGKVELNLDYGDKGLEANPIELEFYVLPNTWTPYEGDFFEFNYINKKLIFMVNKVSEDTLEDGANFYKINLDYWNNADDVNLDDQVVEEYEMIPNNVGTEFKPIIRTTEYRFLERVDDILTNLTRYYQSIFFRGKVQTFICNYNGYQLYDPFLIEFLKRNKIFDNKGEYIYIDHQYPVDTTFAIDYDRTIYRALEKKNIRYAKDNRIEAYLIDDDIMLSLFSSRLENFYKVSYNCLGNLSEQVPFIMDAEIISNIVEGKLFEDDSPKRLSNIVIKYMNDIPITLEDLDMLEDINYQANIFVFYYVPEVMYSLEQYIQKMLK